MFHRTQERIRQDLGALKESVLEPAFAWAALDCGADFTAQAVLDRHAIAVLLTASNKNSAAGHLGAIRQMSPAASIGAIRCAVERLYPRAEEDIRVKLRQKGFDVINGRAYVIPDYLTHPSIYAHLMDCIRRPNKDLADCAAERCLRVNIKARADKPSPFHPRILPFMLFALADQSAHTDFMLNVYTLGLSDRVTNVCEARSEKGLSMLRAEAIKNQTQENTQTKIPVWCMS